MQSPGSCPRSNASEFIAVELRNWHFQQVRQLILKPISNEKTRCFEVEWVWINKQVSPLSLAGNLGIFGIYKAACYITASLAPNKVWGYSVTCQAVSCFQSQDLQDSLSYLSHQILAGGDWWLNSPAPVTVWSLCQPSQGGWQHSSPGNCSDG